MCDKEILLPVSLKSPGAISFTCPTPKLMGRMPLNLPVKYLRKSPTILMRFTMPRLCNIEHLKKKHSEVHIKAGREQKHKSGQLPVLPLAICLSLPDSSSY
jgi:hypothetical protein